MLFDGINLFFNYISVVLTIILYCAFGCTSVFVEVIKCCLLVLLIVSQAVKAQKDNENT